MLVSHAVLAAAVCAATAAPAPTALAAHPFHRSYAEVECKPDKGELQVSLAVLATDFEETLSRRAGKRVNLDRTKGIGKVIENYLAERFVVTLPNGSKPRPSFVGREDKGKIVWIYFTVPLVQPTKKTAKKGHPKQKPQQKPQRTPAIQPKTSLLIGTKLKNRVLMELNDAQLNAVQLREGRWRRALQFEERNQEQVLRTKPKKKTKRKKAKVTTRPAKARDA